MECILRNFFWNKLFVNYRRLTQCTVIFVVAQFRTHNLSQVLGRHSRFLAGRDAIVVATSPVGCHRCRHHFLFLKIQPRTEPWPPCLPWRPCFYCQRKYDFDLNWRQLQTTPDNNRQQKTTTDNRRRQQTTRDNKRWQQKTYRQQQIPIDNSRQLQTTTDDNRQHQTTTDPTDDHRRQQMTTDNNRQQQTTTDNNRQWKLRDVSLLAPNHRLKNKFLG